MNGPPGSHKDIMPHPIQYGMDSTEKIFNALKENVEKRGTFVVVVGGGGTGGLAYKYGIANEITHTSTAGTAALKYLLSPKDVSAMKILDRRYIDNLPDMKEMQSRIVNAKDAKRT